MRSSAKWALSVCTVVYREKELYYEFEETRITEDSVEICQEGIEQVQRVHERGHNC